MLDSRTVCLSTHSTHTLPTRTLLKRCVGVIGGIVFALLSFTAPSGAADLLDVYRKALEFDPTYAAAGYEYEAALTLPDQGLAYLLPSIDASAGRSYYAFYPNRFANYGSYTGETLGLSLRQPIFNIARFLEYSQNLVRFKLADVQHDISMQEITRRTISVYFDVLIAYDAQALVDFQKKAVLEQLEQARTWFKAGEATIGDVHDAEARYQGVLADEIEAKNTVDIRLTTLKSLTDTDYDALDRLRDDIVLPPPAPDDLNSWVTLAKEKSSVIKYNKYNVEFYHGELVKNRAGHLPVLELNAGWNQTNTQSFYSVADPITYKVVGLQLSLPIFSGGYTSAKVSESLAKLNQARQNLEGSILDVTQKLSAAFWGVKGAAARVTALQQSVRAYETALASTKMGLKAGTRTLVDILNAQQQLYSAKRGLLQARYDYIINLVALKYNSNMLSGDDILIINGWLTGTNPG
jgi:TolC family type I secretion outer membrane protein